LIRHRVDDALGFADVRFTGCTAESQRFGQRSLLGVSRKTVKWFSTRKSGSVGELPLNTNPSLSIRFSPGKDFVLCRTASHQAVEPPWNHSERKVLGWWTLVCARRDARDEANRVFASTR